VLVHSSPCGLWFKVSTYHPKNSKTQLFPFVRGVFKCFVREEKQNWNKKGLRKRGSTEDKILEF